MLYNHNEIKNKYKSTYLIRKTLGNKGIYKFEKGIFFYAPSVHYLAVIMKKYPYE